MKEVKPLSFIREVHTYGQVRPIERGLTSFILPRETQKGPQHRGLGKKLIKEAEKITRTELSRSGKKKSASRRIAVISGVGVRGYYRKLGYRLENTYMVKSLD